MPLGERVMVLEGLRIRAESPRYARAVGAGGAGGKGIARPLGNYSSASCATCLDPAEYQRLAAQRRSMAAQWTAQQASELRRSARGDAAAGERAINLMVAAKAAQAAAANADAKASIARQLRTADPSTARRLIDALKQLAASTAAILKSDRHDWIPSAGGYGLLMSKFGARKKTLAGLGATWDPVLNRWTTSTATVDSGAGMVNVSFNGESRIVPAVTCPAGQITRLVTTATDGRWYLECYTPPTVGQQWASGANVTSSWMDPLNRAISTSASAADSAMEAAKDTASGIIDTAGDLAKTGACYVAKTAADRIMADLGCGDPPFSSAKCKTAAAAQARIIAGLGCAPPKEYADAAAPEPSMFSGALKIAIPGLLALALLGGGK